VTRHAWNRAAKLLGAVAIAAVAASLVFGQVREAEAGRRDQADVARMTQKMKTVCIGRFLIDLPDETRFELRGPRIDGLDISSFDESETDFQARLAQREAKLRATPDRLGGNRNVESATEVKTDNGVIGKIFVHGRTIREGTRARGMELERYRFENVATEAMVHSQGMSFYLFANKYDPDQVQNLPKLVAKLVPNPHNQISTEPGFCIDRAWFRDPLTADQGEEIMMSAQLPSHPDFEFLAILAAGNKPSSQSLLERTADSDAAMTLWAKMRVSNLRAAPRTIGGVTGNEVVTRVAETNDTVGYSFWWEVAGTADNVLVPHFVFQMTTGEGDNGPVTTSMSQDAAMALWDKISSSIRLHTPNPVKQRATVPPASASARASQAPQV
jgi:hypothetical protein